MKSQNHGAGTESRIGYRVMIVFKEILTIFGTWEVNLSVSYAFYLCTWVEGNRDNDPADHPNLEREYGKDMSYFPLYSQVSRH